MKPTIGTPAYKAYQKGVEAFDNQLGEESCPYITNKVQALRSWWMVGYRELDNARLHTNKVHQLPVKWREQ